MTETIKFIDGVNYTEADQADFNMNMRPQGILGESSLGVLSWSAIGGMFIRVVPGAALIRGFLYKNDANKDIAVGANSSGSTRIDTLVIRVNPTSNTAVAQLVVGTPGAGAPTLTQVAGGIWDFPLCDITVVNGASSIITSNVTSRALLSLWPTNTIDTAAITTRINNEGVNAFGACEGHLGILLVSNGISNVNKTGTGVYLVTLSSPIMAGGIGTTNYMVLASADGSGVAVVANPQVLSNTSFRVNVFRCSTAAAYDPDFVNFLVMQ